MTEPYTPIFQPPARRALAKVLPEPVATAALEFIWGDLRQAPYRVGKPLRPPFDGIYSARRGAYRVLYYIDEARRMISIEDIRPRSDAYRT